MGGGAGRPNEAQRRRRSTSRKVRDIRFIVAMLAEHIRTHGVRCLRGVHGRQSLILSALAVLTLGGGGGSRAFGQAVCGITSSTPLRVQNATDARAVGVAVNCTNGGTVEAVWAGAVMLDSPISVGSGTFLYITGQDEQAEVRGGFQTRMFEVSPYGGLSLTQLKLSGGNSESAGAIYSRTANVTLESCVFEGNVAEDGDGGAVLAEGGTLTIVGGQFSSNNATENGGAVSVLDGGFLVIREGTRFGENYAESRGGALYGGINATMTIDGCTIENNVTPGSGGGIAASSATLGGSTLLTENYAAGDGGGVVGWDSEGTVEFNSVVCRNNTAGASGGCFHGWGGGVISNGTLMQDNRAESGAAMHAGNGSEIYVNGGNFTTNRAAGNGGFVFVSAGAVLTVRGGTVSNNVAERRAGAVYCSGTLADSGSSEVTIEGGTFSNNEALELGGAIVAWGAPTVVTITGGVFRDNAAKFYGGFIFLEEEASLSCTGARIRSNSAGDQGGGIYARDATWVNSSCDLIRNSAPQGAAAYLTYVNGAFLESHTIADSSASGVSVVFATESSIVARGVNFQSEVSLQEDSSNRAVRLEGATTLVADRCVFGGWMGETVIHHEGVEPGSLVLNACDFSGSSAVMVITSPNSDAGVRNAFVGDLTIENAAMVNSSLVLIDRALDCDDPSACGPGECVDSVLGVLCECIEDNLCLDDGGALSIDVKTAPPEVTYSPDLVNFELMVSAAGDGTTPVIWKLAFESSDLDLQPLPPSGILSPGGNVTVTVAGTPLKQDLGGTLVSRFNVTSVGSDNLEATSGGEIEVESTFFYCQAFEYANPVGEANITCEQCITFDGAEGLDCEEPGATLASMPVIEGYWRSSQESLVIHPCLHSAACTGATQVSSSDGYCEDGYEGPYCAVCSEGFGPGVDYTCHSCTGAKSRWLIFAGALFALVISVVVIFAVMFLIGGLDAVAGVRRSLTRTTTLEATERGSSGCGVFGERLKRWASRVPQDKLKILVVVWQILTVFPSVTGVSFPPVYSQFLSWIDAVNFDIGSIFSTSCIMPGVGFYHRLLLTTLAPLGLAAVLVLTYQMAKRRVGIGSASLWAMKAAWSRHMAAGLLLTFLVFTSTSTIAFETFACDDEAVEGESYLRADYRLTCYTTKHKWYMVYAGVMILVYPIGIPLLYACILWKNRIALNPRVRDTTDSTSGVSRLPMVRGFAANESAEELEERLEMRKRNPDLVPSMFLWKDFGPDMYYYEVIECGRRILLTGALIFIAPNTAAQAAVACMFAFASLLGFELLRPHLDPVDSWLYRLGCVVIFLSNFLALLIKADAAGESSRSFLGGVMVSINVLLILAVLFASCLTTQQEVGDHFDGNNAVTIAGTMLTFEQRTAANARSARAEMAVSTSPVQTRRAFIDGVDDFSQSGGLPASTGHGQELHTDHTASRIATPSPSVARVAQSLNTEERGRGSSFLARASSRRLPRARISPEAPEKTGGNREVDI